MSIHQITLDSDHIIVGYAFSNVLAEGAIEIDAEAAGIAQARIRRARWIGSEVVPFEPEPPPPTLDDYRLAIQAHVDVTAQAKSYDSGVTCSSYVNSTIPTWAAQATAFVAWRDAVWAYAFTELDKVQAGTRPQPTVAEILGELPAMAWPA